MLRSFIALLCFVATPLIAVATPPNIVLILIDDLGVTDLGCQGSKLYQTPQLDRLSSEGIRCNNSYSSCTVCSPTRAAVMTGKYPARLHITDWIAGHSRPQAKLSIPNWQKSLPLEEQTIAEVLGSVGYHCASFGKWHLGNTGALPTDQGFLKHFGGHMHGQPPSYFAPYKLPNVSEGPDGEYLTDRITDEVLKYLGERAAEPRKPFFIYLPHFAVHTPIQSPSELVRKYEGLVQQGAPQSNPKYAAMIENLDTNIGRLRAELEKLKLAENTLIIFTSDNGGLVPVTANPPFRAGKGSAYEGGVRVPFIAWSPKLLGGATPRTYESPLQSIDLLPTLAAASGITKLPADIDGVSHWEAWKSGKSIAARPLYWHYPHYHPGGATPYSAVRDGDYRLVEFFEDGRVELYNLKDDIGEQHDLAQEQPALTAKLHTQLAAWRKSVNAQLPTPNPNYDPGKTKTPGKKPAGK